MRSDDQPGPGPAIPVPPAQLQRSGREGPDNRVDLNISAVPANRNSIKQRTHKTAGYLNVSWSPQPIPSVPLAQVPQVLPV